MAAETQYTPNIGMQTISTANSNLDGSGTISAAIITGASNGTLIKNIFIKAITNTSKGMVRLFVDIGAVRSPQLIMEMEIPAVIKSSINPAFQITVPLNYYLKSGFHLYASTQNAETFNIIAEGQNWAYYATSVRSETTKYAIANGVTLLDTANSNLDGTTGTYGTVMTANDCNLQNIKIKALESTTADGMVRLFLYDGTSVTKLWMEVPVPAVTQSGTASTFYHKIEFNNGFALKDNWQIKASTENSNDFSVVAEALDWSYPA
jgi:hypothetical protein